MAIINTKLTPGTSVDHRSAGRKRTRPIQSLDRGLALLQAVGNSRRPMSLGDLASILQVDRSSVFRLANTLERRGFLFQLSSSKQYVLGSAVWALASQMPWSRILVQLAREHVLDLAAQTGETAHLAVREGVRAVFVDHALTLQPLGVSVGTGRAEPLHCTALGKALIADFVPQALADLFDGLTLSRLTKRTICTIDALAREIKRTRQWGYAVDDEEFHEGVRCVAAPIRDASGAVTAAIGISAPAGRIAKHNFKKVGQQVKDVAQQVTAKLRDRVPSKEDTQ